MSPQTWQEWLAEKRAMSQMTATVIPLSGVQPWGLQEDRKRFGRPDGGFFSLVGVHVVAQREVQDWKQPLLKETGEGAVVLICAWISEQPRYLLAARQEPGNTTKPGNVLLGPSLQTSWSNLQQTHGGKRPPRAELLDGHDVKWVTLAMDGGRFFGKVVRYATVEETRSERIVLVDNERWFTRDELREAYSAGELNEHLCQVLLGAVL